MNAGGFEISDVRPTPPPVKFSLAGDQGLEILSAGSPSSQPIACDSSAPSDTVEETSTAGGSSLAYDPVTDTYT